MKNDFTKTEASTVQLVGKNVFAELFSFVKYSKNKPKRRRTPHIMKNHFKFKGSPRI